MKREIDYAIPRRDTRATRADDDYVHGWVTDRLSGDVNVDRSCTGQRDARVPNEMKIFNAGKKTAREQLYTYFACVFHRLYSRLRAHRGDV